MPPFNRFWKVVSREKVVQLAQMWRKRLKAPFWWDFECFSVPVCGSVYSPNRRLYLPANGGRPRLLECCKFVRTVEKPFSTCLLKIRICYCLHHWQSTKVNLRVYPTIINVFVLIVQTNFQFSLQYSVRVQYVLWHVLSNHIELDPWRRKKTVVIKTTLFYYKQIRTQCSSVSLLDLAFYSFMFLLPAKCILS